MKETTLARWVLRGIQVSVVTACLAFSCAAATGEHGPEHESKGAVIHQYQEVWDKTSKSLELQTIKAAVAQLKSASEGERAQALERLHEQTGLEGRLHIGGAIPREASPAMIWGRYLTNFEKAISEKVPKILAARTWQNQFDSEEAARLLGEESPHPMFLPLLRQVCANTEESHRMRYFALTSITLIPHDGMIEFLIGELETDLAFRAWEQLNKLTKAGIYKNPEGWSNVKERYEKWWAENKDEYKYDRGRALIEK